MHRIGADGGGRLRDNRTIGREARFDDRFGPDLVLADLLADDALQDEVARKSHAGAAEGDRGERRGRDS